MGLGLSSYIPIAVLLLTIPVVLLTVFHRVEWGLSYLVFFLPLQNILEKMHAYPLGKDFVDILIVSTLVGCLINIGKTNKPGLLESSRVNLPIFAYILISFVGLWLGSFYLEADLPLTLENTRLLDWKNLVLLPILFLVTLNGVRDKKSLYIILAVILVSTFFTDFFFYKQFKWIKRYHYSHGQRIGGPFSYLGPNELGAFFVQSFTFITAMFLSVKRPLVRIPIVLLGTFSLYCLLYSYSRAAYLSVIPSLFFLLLSANRKLVPIFLLLLLLIPQFLPTSVRERIDMTFLSEDDRIEVATKNPDTDDEAVFDPSAQGRLEIWKDAFDLFERNPLFGAGFRTFSRIYGYDTHNNYLKVLAELGITGFLLYLYLYYLAFTSGWRLYRTTQNPYFKGLGLGFAACVLANALCNLTHDNWSYINLMGHYWILWGLVEKAHRFEMGSQEQNPL